MTWVLRYSEETLGRRLVLLALANYAHADGSNAFPAVATLAADTRMSERQVQRALRGMEADGSIARAGEGLRGTSNWTIRMTGGDNLSGVTNRAESRPEMSPEPSVEPSVKEKDSLRSSSRAVTEDRSRADEPSSGRIDVDSLCMRLAGHMLRNDPKARIPKTVSAWKRWQDAARLLIDAEERHFEEAVEVLNFCQADEFWKANILSMPTFREKYPQLRAKWIGSRQRVQAAVATHQQPSTADLLAAYERRNGDGSEIKRRAGVR